MSNHFHLVIVKISLAENPTVLLQLQLMERQKQSFQIDLLAAQPFSNFMDKRPEVITARLVGAQ